MIDRNLLRLSDLRGLARLGVTATSSITALVEAMHAAIARPDLGVRGAAPERTSGITGMVYRSIRGATGLTGNALDTLLTLRPAASDDGRRSPPREAVIAVLNGVLGDHLAATGNPLALPMRLHRAGEPLTLRTEVLGDAAFLETLPDRGSKLLVLVHGLCMNDLQWKRDGHDHGAMLADALGYTPLYLHYNSGLSIAGNGRQFAELLETLQQQWPVPIDEIAIVGHSMGGLIARSACRQAERLNHAWLKMLRHLVCMGSPHHGAPLERGGNWIDMILTATPFAAPLARVGKIRSAGITDLRHGHPLDAHAGSSGRRNAPLPRGVRCYAIAATAGQRRGDLQDRWLGDGLVPVASALGHHPDPKRDLSFPKSRQWIAYETSHLELLSDPAVADRLLRWLKQKPRQKAKPRL